MIKNFINLILNKISNLIKNFKNKDSKEIIIDEPEANIKNDFEFNNTSNNYEETKELIAKNLKELNKRGIVLLDAVEKEDEIYGVVNSMDKVVSFGIDTSEGRKIVLRIRPHFEENISMSELIKTGKEAYKNGQYDNCINAYKQLFQLKKPKTFVYAKLGLAYMKKKKIKTAISYLTVATSLSKLEDNYFDFTELIEKLSGKDKKEYFRMEESEFDDRCDNYYGIENIDEFIYLVSSGIFIDKVCLNMGLTEEEKSIATLILAREYYTNEFYELGDMYLKRVERTKNKSEFVKSLFNEITRNKKFYKNRREESDKRIRLSLK